MLRRPQRTDVANVFARYASDPVVTRYLSWPTHQSMEQTHGFVTCSDAEWQAWPASAYLVEARHTGQLLGGTGLHFKSLTDVATGYVLAQDAWGQGYATEALTALLTLCPALGLKRVSAWCHHEHRASQRVLEKCGFQLEAGAPEFLQFPNLGSTTPVRILRYAYTV